MALFIDIFISMTGFQRLLRPKERNVLARGYSLEELEVVRAKKAEKRGTYVDKILLKEVEE